MLSPTANIQQTACSDNQVGLSCTALFPCRAVPIDVALSACHDALTAFVNLRPVLLVAELRSTGRFPRKGALKRGSFMGIRAPLAFTNATDLIRRHSGDAYASSHKLLSGAYFSP